MATDPYNAWLDPILTNEWHLIGWNNVNEMTRMGMPGVYAWGTFDTWSPGYLMFMAATHNGISRLYETFGNSGSADTEERTLTPAETSRTWYRQNPPISRVRWSLRNNNNYEQTGVLISLNYLANNRVYFLRNFYDKSKRSILKARVEGPAAYVFPANDPRLGSQAELLRILQKQAVEISRATASFSVKIPVRPPAGGGRRTRCRRGAGAGACHGRRPRRLVRRALREPQTRKAPPRLPRNAAAAAAAGRDARVSSRQLHRPNGSTVFTHRRRAARLPVPGRRTIRRLDRTTTPGGRFRKGSASRRFV